MTLDPSVFPTSAPAPKLVPVFVLNIKVDGESIPVYKNPAKDISLDHVRIKNGEIKPIPNAYGLEFTGTAIHGTDDLTGAISRGVARLDCKLYGKTANGSGFQYHYGGVLKFNESVIKVLTNQSKLVDFEEFDLTSNPKIFLDADADKKDLWVQDENFIGKGRFIRDTEGALYVQYYVYIIR